MSLCPAAAPRVHAVSLLGSRQIDTPNIDSIGSNSVTFLRHYTTPVCSPTRLSFMSGRNVVNHGVFVPMSTTDVPDLRKDYKFLPEYLAACCEYKSHVVGKVREGKVGRREIERS
jgi:arylsulfatase A-like enzyme